MQLEKIISISGKPGLFKLVSQLRNGFIIEDVTSKKKVSIGNSSQVSLLDNIAMFTFQSEVALFDVFENIAKDNGYKETISHKSSDNELKELMEIALPNYDTERVYVSDIKKLVQWYNILHKAGYITETSFVKEEIAEEVADATAEVDAKAESEPKEAAAPKKKAAAKSDAKPKTAKAQAPKASTGSKAQAKPAPRKQG